MKVVTKSKQTRIEEILLKLLTSVNHDLRGINDDLEFEFGKDISTKLIGKTKNDEKFYLSLRDQYGSILTELISDSLSIVKELGLDEKSFRDNLDEIFNNPEFFNGEFRTWQGLSPTVEAMELDNGIKNWWSRQKKK
jgi:hypothetical protein